MKQQIASITAAVFLAFIFIVLVADAPQAKQKLANSDKPPQESNEKEPIVAEAESYVTDHDVSIQEATSRLRLQDDIGKLDRQLMIKEGDTFAGLWIQHEPDFKVIARFTQNGRQIIEPYIKEMSLEVPVEIRPADATLDELVEAQDKAVDIAAPLDVPAQTGIDVVNNRATLQVEDRSRLVAALNRKDKDLPEQAAVAEVEELLEPSARMIGGLNLRAPGSIDCTSGFSVRHGSGTNGTTTAAHCQDYLLRRGQWLPVVNGAWGGPYDFQWHRTPRFADRPVVRDRYGTRSIRRIGGRFSQPLGARVCHYGNGGSIPEFRCGRIRDRFFGGLQDVPNPTSTYIKVVNYNQDIEDRGDSGGPWYKGRTALGMHVAGDRRNVAAYMSVAYFRDFNVRVKTRR